MGNIQDVAINASGSLLCTLSNDKSLKVFDVVNFGTGQFFINTFITSNNILLYSLNNLFFLPLDMINMMKLAYVPGCCEWVHSPGDAVSVLAVYGYFQSFINRQL